MVDPPHFRREQLPELDSYLLTFILTMLASEEGSQACPNAQCNFKPTATLQDSHPRLEKGRLRHQVAHDISIQRRSEFALQSSLESHDKDERSTIDGMPLAKRKVKMFARFCLCGSKLPADFLQESESRLLETQGNIETSDSLRRVEQSLGILLFRDNVDNGDL